MEEDYDPTPEEYWQDFIDNDRAGDSEAARILLNDLILTLKGIAIPLRGGIATDIVKVYLIEVLEAALKAPAKKVSDALNITGPAQPKTRGTKHKSIREKFLWWYRQTLEKKGKSLAEGRLDTWDIEQWACNLSEKENEQLPPQDTLTRWVREACSQWPRQVEIEQLLKDVPWPKD